MSGRAAAGDGLVGTVLQDSYRVIRLIGRGGMGAVYEGMQHRLTRTSISASAVVEPAPAVTVAVPIFHIFVTARGGVAQRAGARFESAYYLTFVWNPPAPSAKRAEDQEELEEMARTAMTR